MKSIKHKYIRFVFVSLVILLAMALVSCRTTTTRSAVVESTYKLGMSHLVSGDTQAAFVKFHEVLNLKSNHKESLNGLGYVYLDLDDYEKAEESFRKSVKVDKMYSEAQNNLCYSLYRQDKFTEAIGSCEDALKNPLYRTPEKAYYNMGRSYHKMGKFPEAVIAFENAVKRHPGFFQGYYMQALSYNANRQFGKAAKVMNLAVGLDHRFQGDKQLAESKFKQLRDKGFLNPKEVDIFLEILHY
jgi:type IV pilus assembly protein PilF